MASKRVPRFEVFEGEDGWRYRIRHANGRIAATSEAYSSRGKAKRMADNLSFDLFRSHALVVVL